MKNFTPEEKYQIKKLLITNRLLEALNIIDEQNTIIEVIMLKGRVNRLIQQQKTLSTKDYENQLEELKKSIYKLADLEPYAPTPPIIPSATPSNLESRISQLYKKIYPNTPLYENLVTHSKKHIQLQKERRLGLIMEDDYFKLVKQIENGIKMLEDSINK